MHNVHLYVVVRVTMGGIEASSMGAALNSAQKIFDDYDIGRLIGWRTDPPFVDGVLFHSLEYADEIESAIVDCLDSGGKMELTESYTGDGDEMIA